MAILHPNQTVGAPRGRVGDLIYAHYADGRVVIRHRPVRKADWTPGEQASQGRFALAITYQKRVLADPQKQLAYKIAARIRRKRACDLALADFLVPPLIEDIDLSGYAGKAGDLIHIRAADDFEVWSVQVEIRQLDGVLLEAGAAVASASGQSDWVYASATTIAPGQTVVIQATAADRPENTALKALHCAVSTL